MILRFLPFILLLAAAPDPAPPPMQTLQLTETPTPEGEQKVLPGAIIAKAALATPDSAILAADVTVGGKRLLARGTILRADRDADTDKPTLKVFCQPPRVVPPGTAPAAVPEPARTCLFDANSDGKFDHAFPLGTPARPVPIAATEFGRIDGRPLGAGSVAQLRYLGPVQSSDVLAFELDAYVRGWKSAVPHPRTVISTARLPAYGVVGTAVVTVLAYDRATRTATIRMDHGLAPGRIEVPELNRGY